MKAGVKCATISILWGLYSGVGLLGNEFCSKALVSRDTKLYRC